MTPRISTMLVFLTVHDEDAVLQAALDAVAYVEGWAGCEHRAVKLTADETYAPSRELQREFRRQLRQHYDRIKPFKKAGAK